MSNQILKEETVAELRKLIKFYYSEDAKKLPAEWLDLPYGSYSDSELHYGSDSYSDPGFKPINTCQSSTNKNTEVVQDLDIRNKTVDVKQNKVMIVIGINPNHIKIKYSGGKKSKIDKLKFYLKNINRIKCLLMKSFYIILLKDSFV